MSSPPLPFPSHFLRAPGPTFAYRQLCVPRKGGTEKHAMHVRCACGEGDGRRWGGWSARQQSPRECLVSKGLARRETRTHCLRAPRARHFPDPSAWGPRGAGAYEHVTRANAGVEPDNAFEAPGCGISLCSRASVMSIFIDHETQEMFSARERRARAAPRSQNICVPSGGRQRGRRFYVGTCYATLSTPSCAAKSASTRISHSPPMR